MRKIIDITVHGTPCPQGSKNPWGGEANKGTKPWRDRVAQVVGEKLVASGESMLTGPVRVEVTFAFTRPASHYRTGKNAGVLKDSAPLWHTAPNDTDKLQRAIGDALTGTAWKDDKLIASWSAEKIYDERAYAHIRIIDLAGGSHDEHGSNPLPAGAHPGGDHHAGSHALPLGA